MVAEILVLGALANGPQHGYELSKGVERTLGPEHRMNPNTLYPLLRQLLQTGLVEREVLSQLGKPNRHVYRLTDAGLRKLQDLLREFPPEMASRDLEFRSRVLFFAHLTDSERTQIVQLRKAALQERVARFEEASEDESRYVASVAALTARLATEELLWLESL